MRIRFLVIFLTNKVTNTGNQKQYIAEEKQPIKSLICNTLSSSAMAAVMGGVGRATRLRSQPYRHSKTTTGGVAFPIV